MVAENIRGSLRRNQIIMGMGPGSIVDLKKGSVVISGISKWNLKSKNGESICEMINSYKLEKILNVKYFLSPPYQKTIRTEEGAEIKQKDILAYQFPRWGYCPFCKKLGQIEDFNLNRNGKLKCTCDKQGIIIPSRFIVACENGHIEDFPYREWVHRGATDCKKTLTICETGTSAGLESILIKCECGAVRNLEGIFSPEQFDHNCSWLGIGAKDQCNCKMKVLQRSSSAVYYPVTASSIEVPQWNQDIVNEIEKMKDYLNDSNKELISDMIAKNLNTSKENVLDEINKNIGWNGSLEDEYRALREEYNRENFCSQIEAVPEFIKKYVNKIVLIKKMTETIAQLGFKRIDPNYDINDENSYVSFKKEGCEWLPAIQNKGEGIFIELNESELQKWENLEKVQNRYYPIVNRSEEGVFKGLRKPITPRTILLHTLAHSLIKELTFECGYSASSIKERIYSTFEEGSTINMSGILLYTTSSDSDGSLGGLVSQGKNQKFEMIFRRMLDNLAWCSTDPLCIESNLHGYKDSNYAACHACTLLPETSCELRNILLDRASIRGTLDNVGIGFLKEFYENEEIN